MTQSLKLTRLEDVQESQNSGPGISEDVRPTSPITLGYCVSGDVKAEIIRRVHIQTTLRWNQTQWHGGLCQDLRSGP